MIAIIFARDSLNATTSLCRIGGVVVRPSVYPNGGVYCPIFLGTSPTSIEFSVNDGLHYYILSTIPAAPASNLSATWNQLAGTSFYFGWSGLTSTIVDVTLYVIEKDTVIAKEITLPGLANTGSVQADIFADTLVVAVRVSPAGTDYTKGTLVATVSMPTPPNCNWRYCGSQVHCIGQPTLLTLAPLNTVDGACQRHDVCYQQKVLSQSACDAILLGEIRDAMSGCTSDNCKSDQINFGNPVDSWYTTLFLGSFTHALSTKKYYSAYSYGDPHLYSFQGCYFDYMVCLKI